MSRWDAGENARKTHFFLKKNARILLESIINVDLLYVCKTMEQK